MQRYFQRPEAKARRRAYMQRPEVKARRRAYMQRPEAKARRRARLRKKRLLAAAFLLLNPKEQARLLKRTYR